MITHPYLEITIDAPVWMRKKYKQITGKSIDKRYKEKVDEFFVNCLVDLIKNEKQKGIK